VGRRRRRRRRRPRLPRPRVSISFSPANWTPPGPHPPPGPGSLPHQQPGVAGRFRGTRVGRGEQSTRLLYAGVIECYLPMVFLPMVFFTVLFLLASVGVGERRQKGTRAPRTCFTQSKKINLLILFYFLIYFF